MRKRRDTDEDIGTKGCSMKDFTQKVKDNTFHHIFEGTDLNLEHMYVTYSRGDSMIFRISPIGQGLCDFDKGRSLAVK